MDKWQQFVEEQVYTEPIIRLFKTFKTKLPADFPLETRIEADEGANEMAFFIVLCVDMRNFGPRAVEGPGGKLEIATTLEQLRAEVEKAGTRCVIEKN